MMEIKGENINNAVRGNEIYVCIRKVWIMINPRGATKTIGTVRVQSMSQWWSKIITKLLTKYIEMWIF